ncbi:hypothetical protein [Amycolatopsis sp. cmx-11-12]|uniref:hypothetical protein n=1 Tax=Amycolatopsis sp. cmx-11-12 TaxID=2785795 RepID=UPI003916E4DB
MLAVPIEVRTWVVNAVVVCGVVKKARQSARVRPSNGTSQRDASSIGGGVSWPAVAG